MERAKMIRIIDEVSQLPIKPINIEEKYDRYL